MKDKKLDLVQEAPSSGSVVEKPAEVVSMRLLDVDKLSLDLAKAHNQSALSEAKVAQVKAENSELVFRYLVLQLYRKYGLSDTDSISEAGEIIKSP